MRTPTIVDGDLPRELASELARAGTIAMDTETSGLAWNEDRLLLCQVFSEATGAILVRHVTDTPRLLSELIADPAVLKVFHFAPFDLRFLAAQWHVTATNIGCTKAASKLLDPALPAREHSLDRLVARNLGVALDKGAVRTSDWGAPSLTDAQVSYAVADVAHLIELERILSRRLKETGNYETWRSICTYMPTDAELEIRGVPNPLTY